MSIDPVQAYGLTAVPADQNATTPSTKSPSLIDLVDLAPPTTLLATRISAYVQSQLSADTYRHSMRVYSYGRAIATQCFPAWNLQPGSPLDESWFCTAMLHDIGTTEANIAKTRLSYEFWAGYHAIDILQNPSATGHADQEGVADQDQAESVAEAIIRHQDVQDVGKITLLTRLIHNGTLLDNIGAGRELVHIDTIRVINEKYPRKGWSGCFRSTVEKEKSLKPWAMVSRIGGFEEKIETNGRELMQPWD